MKLFIFALALVFVFGLGAVWLYAKPEPQVTVQQSQPLSRPHPSAVIRQPLSPTRLQASDTAALIASAHTIGQVTLSPNIIATGSAQPITATAIISDPALVTTSINLIYSQPGNPSSTIVGMLHDDGLNGDAIAGDNVYTIVFSFPTSTVLLGEVDFQISAAFRGALIRTKSSIVPFLINKAPDMAGWLRLSDSNGLFEMSVPPTWGLHIIEIQNPYPDTVKTCQFLFPDGSAAFYIDVYTPAEWQGLKSSGGGISPLLIGTSKSYYFALEQAQDIGGTPGLTADQELSQLPGIYATFRSK